MGKLSFNHTLFIAALHRQRQHYDVAALTCLSAQQQWHVVITALAEQLAAHPITPTDSPPGRHVNYLSMEFLPGRLTGNNLINLGWHSAVAAVLTEQGLNLSDVLEGETDPALGNRGVRASGLLFSGYDGDGGVTDDGLRAGLSIRPVSPTFRGLPAA